MSINPVRLKHYLPHGSIVEVRSVHSRIAFRGTIRSFSVNGSNAEFILDKVSFRPFGRPRQKMQTNGPEKFEFDVYKSRLTDNGHFVLKSSRFGTVAYAWKAASVSESLLTA